jgi:nicotinate-nucleotide--dimethylbenzimidazole phosphoribosyltransferase
LCWQIWSTGSSPARGDRNATVRSPEPPSAQARAAALSRLDALAKPLGALGGLEDLAAWICGCQGQCPPQPLDRVRAVVLAGDHGVSAHGVSAYSPEVTPAMVRAFVAGTAAAGVLARQHGVTLNVYDLAVDADLPDLPAAVTQYKVRRSSAPLHLADALTAGEVQQSLDAGEQIARSQVAAGADLLIVGDMGIGNTTPAAALIAASLGLAAAEVTGRGTGVDDAALRRKTGLVDAALSRVGSSAGDPVERLAALGSADIAAGVGVLTAAARAGVPVLLDGLVSVAEAVVAEDLAPGTIAWCMAGHRSTEPAQQLALDKLGLRPVLDLSMRLGEGSGALAAVPLLRSAVLLMRDMALLADLTS